MHINDLRVELCRSLLTETPWERQMTDGGEIHSSAKGVTAHRGHPHPRARRGPPTGSASPSTVRRWPGTCCHRGWCAPCSCEASSVGRFPPSVARGTNVGPCSATAAQRELYGSARPGTPPAASRAARPVRRSNHDRVPTVRRPAQDASHRQAPPAPAVQEGNPEPIAPADPGAEFAGFEREDGPIRTSALPFPPSPRGPVSDTLRRVCAFRPPG